MGVDDKKPFSHRESNFSKRAKEGDESFLAVNLPLNLIEKQQSHEHTLPSSQRNS